MNIAMTDELRKLADEWAANLVDERRLHPAACGRFLAIVQDRVGVRWARLHAHVDPPQRRRRARKRAEAAQAAS